MSALTAQGKCPRLWASCRRGSVDEQAPGEGYQDGGRWARRRFDFSAAASFCCFVQKL